ncbi:MAG: DUF86 domain-containing protein [Phycisphaerae bacterium]|nr:DUF86 domain-containing protein [Phycisphaerae bacterium]
MRGIQDRTATVRERPLVSGQSLPPPPRWPLPYGRGSACHLLLTHPLSREFREKYADIPWQAIAGHRDILIHQYDAVDVGEVWLIAKDRIPELVQFLQAVAPRQE